MRPCVFSLSTFPSSADMIKVVKYFPIVKDTVKYGKYPAYKLFVHFIMLRLLEIFGCKRIKNVLCLLLHFLKEGFHENLKLTQNEE